MMENEMTKKLLLLLTLCISGIFANAQVYEIVIHDNTAHMNMAQDYKITTDSLVITAVSDNGRTHVNYLNRKLTTAEKKSMLEFMKKFPVDSLKELYFDGYSNYEVIDDEHFPRSVDLMITRNNITYVSKMTNVWVALYNRIFEMVNVLVPEEAKIAYDKSKFNVFY